MSSSLATSVTPDHPRRDNNSITEMALSTDCTEVLLRITAHISADPTPPSVSWLVPPAPTATCLALLPERLYVSHPGEGARTAVGLLCQLPAAGRLAWLVSRGPLPQPVEAEEGDIVAGESFFGKVGHDLADDAGELEAVTRAGRGDRDLRVVGVPVYDEVVVRSVGEHAGLQVHRGPAAVREVSFGEAPEELLVVVVGLAVDLVGASGLTQVEVLAELEARHAEDGEAVEAALVYEQVEDGEGVRPEKVRPSRLQPGEDLPFRHGEAVQDVEEIPVPGAGSYHEPVGLVSAAVCTYAHTSLQRDPLQYPLVAVYLGTQGLRRHHVGDDAPLRREETSFGLDEREVFGGEVVAGVAPPELSAGQYLVREVVELAGLPRALEDPGFLGAGIYGARDVQELLARLVLDLTPQLVGAPEEQHVGGVFVVGQADDARVPMGRAHRMRYSEPLQAEHPPASLLKVVGGGATHPPYADDDGVVATRVLDVHYLVFPFGDCLAGTLAFVGRAGSGTSSESWSSSWGVALTRAFSGSKKGVWATLAGTGRPPNSTIRLLPGQVWAVST